MKPNQTYWSLIDSNEAYRPLQSLIDSMDPNQSNLLKPREPNEASWSLMKPIRPKLKIGPNGP